MLSCESVSAQWYLFPGKKKDKTAGKNTELTIQAQADTLVEIPSLPAEEEETVPQDIFTLNIPDVFKVALVLPFQANGKPNSNFIEMYSGALLAIREYGRMGKAVELTVIDESEAATPLTPSLLEENHLVVGPVNYSNVQAAMAICPKDRFIVSPLDPKAAALADSNRVIQAPCQWMRQADEVAEWIAGDTLDSDEIVVFKDSISQNIGEQTLYLLRKLEEAGCRYRTEIRISEFTPTQTGTTRVIIASDRDSYINGMVRDLSVVATQKRSDIVLYGTSRIRGSLGVDVEHLHNLQAHYTTGYFIDYEDPAVKSFILSYRALFNNEPGQFAFQGYDTIRYFVGALVEYGEQWYKKLPEYSRRGLQTDYLFEDSDSVGKVNSAVRKIILGKNSSAYIIK